MDEPDGDVAKLERTYERFRLMNAVVSNQRAVYRRWIRPSLSATEARRVLDIGTGGADLPRRTAALGARRRAATRGDGDRSRSARAGLGAASTRRPRARAAAGLERRPRDGRRALRRGDLEPRAAPPRRAASSARCSPTRSGSRATAASRCTATSSARGSDTWGSPSARCRSSATCSRARTSGPTGSPRSGAATPPPSSPRCCRAGWRVRRGIPSRLEVVWGAPDA